MNVVRLTRSGPPSPARRKRRLRSGIAAVAASALLVLTACSGSPDAPATVGPTATPEQPETYEPTLPPYTSEVELSAEDEEDVEELLLLIDEFTYYTAGITEEHQKGVMRLKPNIGSKLMLLYEDMVDDYEERNLIITGEILLTDAAIENFEAEGSSVIAVCAKYFHWGPVNPDTNEPMDDKRAARVDNLLIKYISSKVSGSWKIDAIQYTAKDCNSYDF